MVGVENLLGWCVCGGGGQRTFPSHGFVTDKRPHKRFLACISSKRKGLGPISYSLTPQLAIAVPVPIQKNGRVLQYPIGYWK